MHSLAFLLLPALALASPIQDSTHKASTTTSAAATSTPTNGPITLMSVRSASPIHLQQISASGFSFWIGKNTATYCPSGISGLDCSQLTNSTTAIETGAVNTASGAGMDTIVPGGQELYVTKEGALGYTQAHSANVPTGAYTSGFVYTPPAKGQSYGTLGFTAGGAAGFVACPTSAGGFPYQIFATVKGANTTNCIGFDTFAIPYSGAPAWQYT